MKRNNEQRIQFNGFDPIKRTVKGEKPIVDFYVFKRVADGEMPSYLSSSVFGRWLIGPAFLVQELVVVYDLDTAKWIFSDIEGPVTVIKNLGYDCEEQIAWRDAAGKVKYK